MMNAAGAMGGVALGSLLAYIVDNSGTLENGKKGMTSASPPLMKTQKKATLDPPNPNTVESYIQRYEKVTDQGNKAFEVFSRLHKQPLATHSLIESKDANIPPLLDKSYSTATKDQRIVERVFHSYANKLLAEEKCDSVELIEGPIFSHSKSSKAKTGEIDEKGNKLQYDTEIYNMKIKVKPDQGYKHETKYFYEIVICNKARRHWMSGFQIYKNGSQQKQFSLLKKMKSIPEIQEQTGMTFDISGGSLAEIDFDYLAKQQKFSDYAPEEK